MSSPSPPPPLFGLAVAVAALAGVSVVQFSPAPWPVGVSASCLCLALLALERRWLPRLAAAAFIGAAWAALVGNQVMQQRLPPSLSGGDFVVEGLVLGLPQREDESVRFDFRIERASIRRASIEHTTSELTTSEPASAESLLGRNVRLGWYGDAPPGLAPGSRWRLTVRLKRPRGVLNPGGFDFERRALAQRIVATGYVRQPASARLLASASGIDAWRDAASGQIAESLPEGEARFVQALALGDTRALSPTDWETLRATGLTHQIAISGFHVGMVSGLGALLVLGLYRLVPCLGRQFPRPQAAALGALGFALGYTALAGFAVPTVRTMLMIGVVLLARLLRRAQTAWDSFALALLSVLAFDPLSVLAPGFWLSFLGVGWLLWCLPQPVESGRVRQFLQAQGVAVLGLLPLTVWFFGQASLPGPLANLMGVPVISLGVVPLALLGLALFPLSPAAAAISWQGAAEVMQGLWWLLERMARWPGATVWLPEPGLPALLAGCLAAFWLLLPRPIPGKPLALLLFLPLAWPDPQLPEREQLDVHVVDVGQGLSVLVRTANHGLLYDAGPASPRGLDMGDAAVVPTLRALGLPGLDALLLSHGDNDHAGGMAAVRRAFPEARVLGAEGWARPGMGLCQRARRWRWDGVDFEILHPPPLFPYLRNDSSCVLRIEAGGRVVLLPGDIGRHVEARMLNEQRERLAADLLLVPHHGSKTSSSEDFVAAVAPHWAVVSSGADNRFGLPRSEVVDRYRQAGAHVLDTAKTGALHFRIREEGVTLVSARRFTRRRYWRATVESVAFPGPGTGYAIGNRTGDR